MTYTKFNECAEKANKIHNNRYEYIKLHRPKRKMRQNFTKK